eukprot:754086-Hanusia_phi.AAC.3
MEAGTGTTGRDPDTRGIKAAARSSEHEQRSCKMKGTREGRASGLHGRTASSSTTTEETHQHGFGPAAGETSKDGLLARVGVFEERVGVASLRVGGGGLGVGSRPDWRVDRPLDSKI